MSTRQIVLPCSTPVSNALFDRVMPAVTPARFVVLLAVWRKTVGWDKVRDWISISQFMSMTGLCRETVIQATKFWEKAGFIRRARKGIRGTIRYEIVLGHEVEEAIGRLAGRVGQIHRSKKSHGTGSENPAPLVGEPDTQKAIQEKEMRESNGSSVSDPERQKRKEIARLGIRRRNLRDWISNRKSHLKNLRLPKEDRARFQTEVEKYEKELAELHPKLDSLTVANPPDTATGMQ